MIYTIYGKPKVGKTTLALQGAVKGKTAIINADKGLIGIDTDGFDIIDNMDSASLNANVMTSAFIKRYDRVVIDTATQLYEDMLVELSGGKTPSLNMRGVANNGFSQILRFLRREDKEIIILCQEKMVLPTEDWVSDDDDEEVTASVTMDLPQGAMKTLTIMSDVIGRMYMANTGDRQVRRLWLAPTPNIVAGARSAKYHGKPPYLSNPSISRLNKLLGWTS